MKTYQTKSPEDLVEDSQNGIAIGFTFLILAAFFYFFPSYLDNTNLSYTFVLISLGIGVIYSGFELNKLLEKRDRLFGLDDISLGLFAGILCSIFYYYFSNLWVNLLLLILLFFSFYGISLGFIKISRNLFASKEKLQFKIPLVISQFIGLLATVLTNFDFLGKN